MSRMNRFHGYDDHGGPSGSHFRKSEDPKAIREEMARLRKNMQDDVVQIEQKAKEALDWKSYVRQYPYLAAGAAALAGYLLIPSRRQVIKPTREQLEELAAAGKLGLKTTGLKQQAESPSFANKALLAVGTVATRAVMAYVGKRIGELSEDYSGASQVDLPG